jgi:cholesterol transport system auxiliary component
MLGTLTRRGRLARWPRLDGSWRMTKQMRSFLSLMIALGAVLTLGGCAFFSKNAPLVPRYFTPDLQAGASSAAPSASVSAPEAYALRLGRVLGSDHLRERIAYRTQDGELGYHEGLRWTERPEEYVRRALASVLFEERGMTRVVSGGAPTIELELVAFEELRRSDSDHVAKVTAVVIVHDGRTTRLERTFTVLEPLGDDTSIHSLVRALSRALRACVTQIGSGVEAALASIPVLASPGTASSATAFE